MDISYWVQKVVFIFFSCDLLKKHFLWIRHYGTNRAPLSLSFDPGWLQVNKGFAKVLKEWIREKLASQSDVYFVTQLQVGSADRSRIQ
jgi:hypothetical protein